MFKATFDYLFGRNIVKRTQKSIRSRARLGFEALEDRWVPSTLNVGSGMGEYHTIQSAINAASPGDKILVDPGTYTEQLTIATKNLTLTTASCKPDAIIKAPAGTLAGSAALIDVSGAKNVVINDFTIDGSSNSGTQYGIKVENGASVTITNNTIENITGSNGGGIVVGKSLESTVGSAVIVGNTVKNYTKAGIVIDNIKSSGAVFANTVIGQGALATVVQYGIQVSFGANADVECNDVTGNTLSTGGFDSAGILVINNSTTINAGSRTCIAQNCAHGNEFGFFIVGSTSVDVEQNQSSHNTNDGIQLLGTSCSWISGNTVVSNAGDGISVYGDPTGFGNANNNVISNNLIAYNKGNGVTIDNAAGTVVVANLIFDNNGSGVAVQNGSSNTVIAFNFIDADDGTTAISVTNSTFTSRFGNFITH